ncbi:hypothetical protein [Gordonia alkaliphila]|uniref:DNA-binding protein n=1 Tax=Gordonia alkaliphila TaxID=1053547 RepID=A0ABP8Z4L9_9ACTN
MGTSLLAATPAADSDRLWSTADAVRHGWAYSTVRKHLTGGLLLSAVKVGREWRFDPEELEGLGRRAIPVHVEPDVTELSDPVRNWALEQASSAPPMSAREARLVAAIFRRAAAGGAEG